MTKRQRVSIIEIVAIIVLLTILGALVLFVYQKHRGGTLSAEQIKTKFDCGRITENIRSTDVFCANPKFYNDPDGVTYEDYYKYQACDERLNAPPPPESSKQEDPGYYNTYYNCKDHAKLDSLRLQFIQELKKLKAQNS